MNYRKRSTALINMNTLLRLKRMFEDNPYKIFTKTTINRNSHKVALRYILILKEFDTIEEVPIKYLAGRKHTAVLNGKGYRLKVKGIENKLVKLEYGKDRIYGPEKLFLKSKVLRQNREQTIKENN